MKHNKIWSALVFLLISILFNGFTSCSSSNNSNEENDSSSQITTTLKANKWISRDASYGIGNNDHAWVDIESTCLYFTSDNGGVVYWTQKDYDTDLGNSRNYDYENFTYSVSGNKVIISTESSTSELLYANGYLAFNGGVYEKIAMSSGDYELLRNISPKSGSCGSGLTYIYTPKTKTLQISGNGQMSDYLSSNQPWHDFYIKSVNIEEGCTYVGANAFAGKLELGAVELPNTLTEIGAQAFSGTTITKVSIPDNVNTIGSDAFYNCKYLQTVYLSKNLESVGSGAFANCAIKYQNLTLPDNVEVVGDDAFSGWQAGTLTLNAKLKIIGNGAFTGIKGTLTIPNSVESIGAVAFDGTFSKVVVGTGLKILSRGAFGGSLTSGSMYVNLGKPLDIDGDIMASDNQYKWTLYVPKGSKTAYQANQYWRGFKSIIEDASLVSGNGTPEENGSEETDEEEKPNQNDITRTYVNGYSFIDLGLPSGLLWAEHNIGAKSCKDYGNYYAFGEVNTKDVYIGNNSKWYKKEYPVEKLKPEDDVATVKLGENIHTPAVSDFKELYDNCNWEVVNEQGYQGKLIKYIKVKSKKNTNYIIFPLAGYYTDKLCGTNEMGNYWSSEPYYYNGNSAYCLYIHHGNNYINVYVDYDDRKIRAYGFTVRPVVKK